MNLVADHKLVVGIRYAPAERFIFSCCVICAKVIAPASLRYSGQHVIEDLKNQLEFIGTENVDKISTVFFGTAFHHTMFSV